MLIGFTDASLKTLKNNRTLEVISNVIIDSETGMVVTKRVLRNVVKGYKLNINLSELRGILSLVNLATVSRVNLEQVFTDSLTAERYINDYQENATKFRAVQLEKGNTKEYVGLVKRVVRSLLRHDVAVKWLPREFNKITDSACGYGNNTYFEHHTVVQHKLHVNVLDVVQEPVFENAYSGLKRYSVVKAEGLDVKNLKDIKGVLEDGVLTYYVPYKIMGDSTPNTEEMNNSAVVSEIDDRGEVGFLYYPEHVEYVNKSDEIKKEEEKLQLEAEKKAEKELQKAKRKAEKNKRTKERKKAEKALVKEYKELLYKEYAKTVEPMFMHKKGRFVETIKVTKVDVVKANTAELVKQYTKENHSLVHLKSYAV